LLQNADFNGVLALDTQEQQQNNLTGWSQLNTQGPLPLLRDNWQAVSNNQGQVYLYGGCLPAVNSNCTVNSTTMFIFDILQYSWSTNDQINPPLVQIDYSATMLSSGRIMYIGGAYLGSSGMTPIDITLVKPQIFNALPHWQIL